jgi:hypothetical protein
LEIAKNADVTLAINTKAIGFIGENLRYTICGNLREMHSFAPSSPESEVVLRQHIESGG